MSCKVDLCQRWLVDCQKCAASAFMLVSKQVHRVRTIAITMLPNCIYEGWIDLSEECGWIPIGCIGKLVPTWGKKLNKWLFYLFRKKFTKKKTKKNDNNKTEKKEKQKKNEESWSRSPLSKTTNSAATKSSNQPEIPKRNNLTTDFKANQSTPFLDKQK